MADLTHERLRHLLDYDPETGIFTWLVRPNNRVRIGFVAGCWAGSRKKPYWSVNLDGKAYHANRLAWFYVTGLWPIHQIDHKNLNPLDNTWSNLREATCSQNCMNRRGRGESGAKGVYREGEKWRARIHKEGRCFNLGSFATREEAMAEYASAAVDLHGEFARVA